MTAPLGAEGDATRGASSPEARQADADLLREAMAFVAWAAERIKERDMIFPEEVDVRLQPVRAANWLRAASPEAPGADAPLVRAREATPDELAERVVSLSREMAALRAVLAPVLSAMERLRSVGVYPGRDLIAVDFPRASPGIYAAGGNGRWVATFKNRDERDAALTIINAQPVLRHALASEGASPTPPKEPEIRAALSEREPTGRASPAEPGSEKPRDEREA